MRSRTLLFIVSGMMAALLAGSVLAERGVRRRLLRPEEYGNVVINNFSTKNRIEPVVFRHWIHRSRFTCRVCHIDIGFAMNAEETRITEKDNRSGLYCGTCHNGRIAFGPNDPDPLNGKSKSCSKCHSYGKKVRLKNNFYEFAKGLPRDRFGNRIDWIKAEEKGLIKLTDYIEGVSFKRVKFKDIPDFEVSAQMPQMPDIIFSHKKHAIWNGCELCHPDLFGVKKGSTPYSMEEIFNGRYCGACHDKVAFPNLDCQKCHTKPVY